MRIGNELEVATHTSPFGRRLVLTDPNADSPTDTDPPSLDAREVEQLRDACERFLAGEAITW